MSGTMTVKELIVELLDYAAMDEPVFIGLGPNGIPSDGAEIFCLRLIESGGINYGVYLVPRGNLQDADKTDEAKL